MTNKGEARREVVCGYTEMLGGLQMSRRQQSKGHALGIQLASVVLGKNEAGPYCANSRV
jgi:hypothetical protein